MFTESDYRPSSPILILIIDAFFKEENNESTTYSRESSILNQGLDEVNTKFLIDSRQKIFSLLKTGGLTWQWSDHKDSIFNKNLGKGGDLGFEPPASGLRYLPAMERYSGDFYDNLGDEGKRKLVASPHHILILSGLYGLLCPLEHVQMYDCILDENNENYRIWKHEHGLTRVLVDYIRKKGIKRVFEFASIHDYRNVIDWNFIKDKKKDLDIFHCFYQHADGEKGLNPLGKFLKDPFLETPEIDLMAIQSGHEWGHILFSAQQYRTNKTIKRPLPKNWEKLRLDLIADNEVKSHLLTAETLTQTLYRSPNVPPDAGSTIIIEYAKGLERMLNFEVARQIRAHAFGNYASKSFKLDKINFFNLPENLRQILQEDEEHMKAINPRGWATLRHNLNNSLSENYPGESRFIKEILDLLGQKYGRDFDQIEDACQFFSQYRDKAAHNAVLSLDVILKIRNEIVKNLNSLIILLYDKYGCDLDTLINDSQSTILSKRLNAILGLGSTGSERAIPPLIKCLVDHRIIVRGFAAESLGHLNKREAATDLRRYITKERDRDVLDRMTRGYSKLVR